MERHRRLNLFLLCFVALMIFPRNVITDQLVHKEKIRQWYATSNEFLVLPCYTEDELNSDLVSMVRWFESYGNPVWASFNLTIQVYDKEDKRNFFCDTFDWKGDKSFRFWHKIDVYVQPLIFFDFLSSIPTDGFFSIEHQTMTSDGDAFVKKVKKKVAKVCAQKARCRFAGVFPNQSLKEKISLSSKDATAAMLQLADKYDNKTTQLSVLYQIDINDLHFMGLSPEAAYHKLRQLMSKVYDPETREVLLSYEVPIKITPSMETICPVGYVRHGHSIRCLRCLPGSAGSVGSASCTRCARGFYQPEAAQAECIPCPPMYVTNDAGAKNLEECVVDGNLLIIIFEKFMKYFWNILAHADFENYNLVLLGIFVYFFGSTLIVMRLLYRIYIFKSLKTHYERIQKRLMKVAALGQFSIAERQNIQIKFQKILNKERDAMQTNYL